MNHTEVLADYESAGRNASACALKWGISSSAARERVRTAKTFAAGTPPIENIKLVEYPAWPSVQPAKPAIIKYLPKARSARQTDLSQVFIIPDIQIGYYRQDDVLVPFHDLAAIDCMLQLLEYTRPKRVVILGDFLDIACLSKYLQIREFHGTLQPSIEYGYSLLCRIRSIVGPDCKIDYVEGNHERRISEYIARNAAAAHGIRKAGNPEWPQLSIPALLRLDELNVDYSATYPGGQVWLTPNLVCQHQPPSRRQDIRASVIHGHEPYNRVDSHTVHYHHGLETYTTTSVGGLMRIDDVKDGKQLIRTSVPSDRSRLPWAQGVAVVWIENDEHFKVELVPITRGRAIFGGIIYQGSEASGSDQKS